MSYDLRRGVLSLKHLITAKLNVPAWPGPLHPDDAHAIVSDRDLCYAAESGLLAMPSLRQVGVRLKRALATLSLAAARGAASGRTRVASDSGRRGVRRRGAQWYKVLTNHDPQAVIPDTPMEITARISELTDAATQREIDAVMCKLHAEGWQGDDPLTKADLAVTLKYAKKARARPRLRTRPLFRC